MICKLIIKCNNNKFNRFKKIILKSLIFYFFKNYNINLIILYCIFKKKDWCLRINKFNKCCMKMKPYEKVKFNSKWIIKLKLVKYNQMK